MKTDSLIERLSDDLTPVQKPLKLRIWLPIWVLISTCYVIGVTLYLGPMRSGFSDQLLSAPRFSLEIILGSMAVVAAATTCLAQSVPGNHRTWMVWFYRVTVAAWLVSFASAFISAPISGVNILKVGLPLTWSVSKTATAR